MTVSYASVEMTALNAAWVTKLWGGVDFTALYRSREKDKWIHIYIYWERRQQTLREIYKNKDFIKYKKQNTIEMCIVNGNSPLTTCKGGRSSDFWFKFMNVSRDICGETFSIRILFCGSWGPV